MISLLSKIFIKDSSDTSSAAVRSAYGTLCGIMGIIFNILLFGIKMLAGVISGSISIMADAFNNLTDAGSSVITLIGFRMSGQKPDRDHPFGHGRIEYISGLIVSMLILLVGFELGKGSVEKIITPEPVEFSIVAIIILVCSIAVKGYMALYNFTIGKKISSAAMRATAQDSLNDTIATTAVLLCLIFAKLTNINIDAYCGLAVSGFILFSGLRAVKETMDPLLGTPPSEEFIKDIEKIVHSYEGVSGIHDLIVHDYGPARTMISLHAEVPCDADMLATHDMIDTIEKELREHLNCDAVIHMDPIATNDELTCEVREKVAALVTCIDSGLTIHDFRVFQGRKHKNLMFDVALHPELTEKQALFRQTVETALEEKSPGAYHAHITFDLETI